MASGQSNADLDFSLLYSVKPGNGTPLSGVIDRCWQLGDKNPIAFIHDVGAGGVSNAFPELVNDGGRGGKVELPACARRRAGLQGPLAIWSDESQDLYVMAVAREDYGRV